MTRNERIGWIGFAVFMAIFCVLMIRGHFLDKKLKNEGIITTATIIDDDRGYRGGLRFVYSFTVNGKKIEDSNSFSELISRKAANFNHKSFPVIYLKDDPSNSHLLASHYSFNKYGVPFPDSLQWITEFEKK